MDNKPKYILLGFEQFSREALSEKENLDRIADRILNENIVAFRELAK